MLVAIHQSQFFALSLFSSGNFPGSIKTTFACLSTFPVNSAYLNRRTNLVQGSIATLNRAKCFACQLD